MNHVLVAVAENIKNVVENKQETKQCPLLGAGMAEILLFLIENVILNYELQSH